MTVNKSSINLLEAVEKGYKVSPEGEVVGLSGKLRKLSLSSSGYQRFNLRGLRQVAVHRLQAYQKFGEKIFEPGIVVRHLNGNPLDNSWDNITIGSQSDNMLDIPQYNRLSQSLKAAAKLRKLSNEEVLNLRKDREDGFSYLQLTEKYGICKSTISYIVNKKTYK